MSKAIFKVSPGDVDNFAKVWTHKGLFFPMSDAARQFATDFANVAIRSFVEQTMANVKAAKETEVKQAAPLVTLT